MSKMTLVQVFFATLFAVLFLVILVQRIAFVMGPDSCWTSCFGG